MNIYQTSEKLKNASRVYFIGIGGISMSSLAMITRSLGYEVSGSDRTASALTDTLEKNGIKINYEHAAENVAGADVVVYTAAVKEDNPELAYAREHEIYTLTRAEYLGWLMSGYSKRIGIAGTHGKSTTTSMISEICMAADLNPTIASGAELADIGGAFKIGGKDLFVFEACEYTDSFLSFCPTTAVVTNIEYDHVDYFKDMDQLKSSFLKYISMADIAVLNFDDENIREIAEKYTGEIFAYGIKNPDVPFSARNIEYENGCGRFDFVADGITICHIELSVPGEHNVYDALAAATEAYSGGVPYAAISAGLKKFRGAKRRFELRGTLNGAEIFDDYAHHPSEIKATLRAAKALGKRIVCVFQPHTFSRTAALFDEFAKCFGDADETIITNIYAARESNTYGVSAEALAERIDGGMFIGDFYSIAEYLRQNCGSGDVIMILGAGDIVKLDDLLLR